MVLKEGTDVRTRILNSMQWNKISEIIYMKENGEFSKRRVKVLSVSEDTFHAYCFLRGTKRTFRIGNVLAFVPVENRERDVI